MREEPAAYIFGTIHVAHHAVWSSLPNNVKTAWRHSSRVYGELDWSDVSTRKQVTKCRNLPHGQTLEQHLPVDVFNKLRRYLRKLRRSLPNWIEFSQTVQVQFVGLKEHRRQLFDAYVGDWKTRRPIWMLLLVNDLTEANLKDGVGRVLDEKLLSDAKERGQTTATLETASEQCMPLNHLNSSLVRSFIFSSDLLSLLFVCLFHFVNLFVFICCSHWYSGAIAVNF